MLTYEQKALLWHLSKFSIADKFTCLRYLSERDREKPEYGLRTLKRWGYVTQRNDGLYGITAKGLACAGKTETWLSCGGNRDVRKRLALTSRIASLVRPFRIYPGSTIPQDNEDVFIPSQVWRKIRDGIASTARFNGMLFFRGERLVVYHIGDGNMDWQLFAERSLFFQNYGKYDDRATGMLLICDNGIGPDVAENIIRCTLYRRKRLLANPGGGFYETDKPHRYSKSPIRLHDQYSRAFLTEEQDILKTLAGVASEKALIENDCEQHRGLRAGSKQFWDIEVYPKRIVSNPANDLFKYLYLFAYLKDARPSNIQWVIRLLKKYAGLLDPYKDRIKVLPTW